MKEKIQDFLRDSALNVSIFRGDNPNVIVRTLREMKKVELRVDANTEKTDKARDRQFWKLCRFLQRHFGLTMQSALDLLVFLSLINYENPWLFGGRVDEDTFKANERFLTLPLSKQLDIWFSLKTNRVTGHMNILFLSENLKLEGPAKKVRDGFLEFLLRNDRHPAKTLRALKATLKVLV